MLEGVGMWVVVLEGVKSAGAGELEGVQGIGVRRAWGGGVQVVEGWRVWRVWGLEGWRVWRVGEYWSMWKVLGCGELEGCRVVGNTVLVSVESMGLEGVEHRRVRRIGRDEGWKVSGVEGLEHVCGGVWGVKNYRQGVERSRAGGCGAVVLSLPNAVIL